MNTGDFSKLVELLKQARNGAVFTGAGISTLSGIRDFRGKNGVYKEPWQGMSVEALLSLEVFEEDPSLFYRWAREFVYRLDAFQPGPVHRVTARLEELGIIKTVITQNIDLLHQRAGSRNVIEVHGSPACHTCLRCRKSFSYDEIAPRVMAGETPHCSCGGIIKPDIIFYGECLREDVLHKAELCMRHSDLLLTLGSSLTVYPAAGLPEAACRHGAKLVIVNDQPTQFDGLAVLRFTDLNEVFTALETAFPKAPAAV